MSENELHAHHQSAYRKHHSVETALVRVTNDILQALDSHKHVVVVLLDLSAAFDTLDHNVLLTRFKERYGINGIAYRWLSSYFTGRQQCIVINGVRSQQRTVPYGVPQGSVIGPMGFSLYSSPIEDIIEAHDLDSMIYADDSQVYFTFRPHESNSSVDRIERCISDIKSWMITNKLMLNDSKTEVLHLTSRFIKESINVTVKVGDANVSPSSTARNLGVSIDEKMTLSQHVSNVCKSASFALYNIGKFRRYLDRASTEKLVHSFVTSRLDNCNSLLFGLPSADLDRLQRVQNSAARLVTRVGGRVHMQPVLRQLHWLPVRKRIIFKMILLTFKAIHGLAPQYLVELLTLYKPSRSLRSSTEVLLKPPSHKAVRTSTYGERAFAAAAPKLWNRMPAKIRAIDSLTCFKSALKTFLFNSFDDE